MPGQKEVFMVARPHIAPQRSAILEERARCMRHRLTPGEAALWGRLCRKQLGVAFRRQVPLAGKYIADFCALAPRVIVEVDGSYHARRARQDARRDRALARLGYRVVRIDDAPVRSDLDRAVALVRTALRR
jgi:very-short-patch-repair endonuclease